MKLGMSLSNSIIVLGHSNFMWVSSYKPPHPGGLTPDSLPYKMVDVLQECHGNYMYIHVHVHYCSHIVYYYC